LKLCVIPARGGSKRIPRKNIRPFAGRPMLAHSILAATASGLFDRIVVSTDDEDIAAVAELHGAEIPFLRPKALADDYTGTNAVARHAIEWFHAAGQTVAYACCVYATAPFLRAEDLRAGYEKLVVSGKSFVFAATRYAFPIQRAIRLNESGEVEAMFPEHIFDRSQDLTPAFHDAGQFYWGTAQAYLDQVTTFSPASLIVELPHYRVQDIDTEDDWESAELMYRLLQDREKRRAGGPP
jgi:pseudaminic acid cytidylyltransferase